MTNYSQLTAEFQTLLDFLRFGLTQAHEHSLHFGHGTDNAWDDILALILDSLHLPYDLEPHFLQARLTVEEKEALTTQLAKRILEKIPVPYLTNTAHFCQLPFYVDNRVLIPRSPIGELIQTQFSPWISSDKVDHILDLCTGSGALAIACHHAFPDALIDATDISDDALEVAAINCERHEVGDNVRLIRSDAWENVPDIRYAIIVSNPPYVGQAEMETLPKEYYHEPRIALEASDDGLAIISTILFNAHHYLQDEGVLIMEVGNSEPVVEAAFPQLAFTWLEFEKGGQGVFLLTKKQLEDYFDTGSNHPVINEITD